MNCNLKARKMIQDLWGISLLLTRIFPHCEAAHRGIRSKVVSLSKNTACSKENQVLGIFQGSASRKIRCIIEEQNPFDDRSENQAGDSDLDYEERHSHPRPGDSEYIPEKMDGLGPTGYRRSDEDVIRDVVQKLATQPGINASQIDARIQDGAVILNGNVRDENQKWLAEDTVLKTPGVVKVVNRLQTDLNLPGASIH